MNQNTQVSPSFSLYIARLAEDMFNIRTMISIIVSEIMDVQCVKRKET